MAGSRSVSPYALAALLLASTLAAAPLRAQPNVLLVVIDDLGIDRVGAYAAHPDPGHTPVIDALAAAGMLFRNAYADPLCSPTRGAMLTGRYGFRTGLTNALNYDNDSWELPLEDVTLAEALPPAYTALAFGKWHLTIGALTGALHPLQQGFDHHAGSMSAIETHGGSYYDFDKWVDGVPSRCGKYATTDTVDDTLARLERTPEPWFTWLAFNAPHIPIHKPPQELHTFALPATVAEDPPLHVKAAIEALDTELGRLLDSLDPQVRANTVVIVAGDNGTDGQATTAPFDPAHAKSTVYEGGIHVPLVIVGPGVPAGTECDGLVNLTDLFATVLELVGGDASSGYDSVSLTPYFADPRRPSLREFVYAGMANPAGYYPGNKHLHAVRGERFKLLHVRDAVQGIDSTQMYDLLADPFELDDLLEAPLSPEAERAHGLLDAKLASLVSPWTDLGGALAGANGPPKLRGQGALIGGETSMLEVKRGLPGAPAFLLTGFELLEAPFKGGVLVPDPSGLVIAFGVGRTGTTEFPLSWPLDIPSRVELALQAWIVDAAGPAGYSATNGLLLVTP